MKSPRKAKAKQQKAIELARYSVAVLERLATDAPGPVQGDRLYAFWRHAVAHAEALRWPGDP